ncbi:MAG: right-handed parallel beta-helix repeat-containing protein, partial [Acidobacteria bacterium]|nr:right-handed parallel beta-helix repeat-containing protein [Acidobacteriota bacterium]
GTSRNVIISESHFYDNRGAGVLLERVNLHQINITNCHISYNTGGGVVVRDSEVRNLQIGSSDIEANMAVGGPPSANVLLDARGGAIREGSITGCTLQHTSEAAGSANIRFLGVSEQVNQKVGYFSIDGNTISDAKVNIDLAYVRGVSITGNTLVLGTEHNLRVSGSSGVVVGPNVMDQNPDYRPAASRNGISFTDSSDCLLSGFVVRDGGPAEAAITLRRCRRCRVSGVSVIDSGQMGVLLEDVEGVVVSGCTLDGRWPVALRLRRGKGNRVVDNVVSGQLDIDPGAAVVERN